MASFPDTRRTLGALLRAAYEALQQQVYGDLAARGFPEIRPAHSALLRHIAPEGSRLTALAAAAGIAKQSMAYLAEDLTAHGIVTAMPDPADGRARLITLTSRGRRLIRLLLRRGAAAEARVAGRIGAAELERLRASLAAIPGAGASPRKAAR